MKRIVYRKLDVFCFKHWRRKKYILRGYNICPDCWADFRESELYND